MVDGEGRTFILISTFFQVLKVTSCRFDLWDGQISWYLWVDDQCKSFSSAAGSYVCHKHTLSVADCLSAT